MIIFLGGDDGFAIARQIKKLREQYAKKHQDSLDEVLVDARVDGYSALEQSFLALPMFFSHRLVVVTGIDSLKDQTDKLEELFIKVPESTVVIIDGRGLDRRTRLYKLLIAQPAAKIFRAHTAQEKLAWVRAEAKRCGAEISVAAAQHLMQRVGSDEWMLASELSKLALVNSTITREIINEYTPKNVHDSVFDLIEAIGRRQTARAIMIYEELTASGANDQQIIATLMWHYRVLVLALERASDDELKACGVKTYSLQKVGILTQSISLLDVAIAYKALLATDIAMKIGEKKAHQAMVDLILQLSEKR